MLNIDYFPKAIRYLARLLASKKQHRFVDGKDSCDNTAKFITDRDSRANSSVFAAGLFIQRSVLEKIFLVFSLLFTHTMFSFVQATPFQQGANSNQPISIEAEHYHDKADQNGHSWVPSNQLGFSGDGAMQALPEDTVTIVSDYAARSPRLDYQVKFERAGTYYVWLRAFGVSHSSNSMHVGLNGQEISSARYINVPVTGDYVWTDGLVKRIEISAPGVHTVNVWMRESGTILDKLVLSRDSGFSPAGKGPAETAKANGEGQSNGNGSSDGDSDDGSDPGSNDTGDPKDSSAPYQQGADPNQPISIEAEHYHDKADQNGHSWVPSNQLGFSGDGAMQALPEDTVTIVSDYAARSPRLDYQVKFERAGTYYVWLRAFGVSHSSNSMHVGLNGQEISSARYINVPVTGDYVWTDGLVKRIEISAPGVHTVNVWMRESGTILDKLVLSRDSGFSPAGKGPAETAKANGEGQSNGNGSSDGDSDDGSDPGSNDTGDPKDSSAPYQQGADPNQPISIEAEHYHDKADQNGHSWVPSNQLGFSGDGAMQALPEDTVTIVSDYAARSPRLDYQVKFERAGTYYVWLRAFGVSHSSNSMHVGLNGQEISSARYINVPVTGDYVWTDGLVKRIEISAPGVHTVNVWMRESGTILDKLVLSRDSGFSPAGKGPAETAKANGEGQSNGNGSSDGDSDDGSDPGSNDTGDPKDSSAPYQQGADPNQPISIEAEHYHDKADQNGHSWVPSNQLGFSGDGAMQALPEDTVTIVSDYAARSPRLDYQVKFERAGTYYVWLRAFGVSHSSNSMHVGLNGQEISSARYINVPVTGDYVWTDGLVKRIEISVPGVHTVNVWMRESGTIIDKLVLSLDAGFSPGGKGPEETAKVNGEGQSNGDGSSGGDSNNGDSDDGSDPGSNDSGDPSSKTIILSWDPSPVSVLGYIVYYGETPETASKEATVLSVDLGTVDALDPKLLCDLKNDLGIVSGEQVCFRVKAYDGSELSDYSASVCTIH